MLNSMLLLSHFLIVDVTNLLPYQILIHSLPATRWSPWKKGTSSP